MLTLHSTDSAKVTALAQSMSQSGWCGRAVLALRLGNECLALTGTHRLAAARVADIEPPVHEIVLDDGDAQDLLDALDDEDRLSILRAVGDVGAVDLMRAELED